MNNNLTRLEKMNEALAKKIEAAKKAQDDFSKEQKILIKKLQEERQHDLLSELKRIGFPLEKTNILLGWVVYAKEELLDNDTNEKAKAQILYFTEKYEAFKKKQQKASKKDAADATAKEADTE